MIFTRSYIRYTKELANPIYNPLTKDEEKIILEQVKSGCKIALDKLIKAHLRFVVYLLRDFKIPSRIDPMDLIQEGNLGLLDAISRFDGLVFENRVASYAQYYVRWYINKALGTYDKDVIVHDLPEDFDFDNILIEQDPVIQEKAHKDILEYIKTFLKPRDAKIVSLSFGLEYPFKPLHLREIGSLLHLNGERVRQIKEEALNTIKDHQYEINILR